MSSGPRRVAHELSNCQAALKVAGYIRDDRPLEAPIHLRSSTRLIRRTVDKQARCLHGRGDSIQHQQ